MNKRIWALFLVLLILVQTSVFSQARALDIEDINRMIIASIEEIYYKKDGQLSDNMLSQSTKSLMSSSVENYVQEKINVHNYAIDKYSTQKENYVIEINKSKSELSANKNHINFEYLVRINYNYVGCDFDTTINEEVYVVYDCDTLEIVDIYNPTNYFDEAVRDTTYSEKSDSKKNILIQEGTSDIIADINRCYTQQTSANNEIKESVSPTRFSSLSLSNVVNYARNNYSKASPSSGDVSVPYYDFSDISGNYDCTNFVSHALLAGGAKMYVSSTGWYFKNINNRSSSWSGVTQLYKYLTTNTHSNTAAGQSYQYSYNGGLWSAGNIMQFSSSTTSDYSHSTIITKKVSGSGGRSYAYVTGRTSKTRNNNNVSADDVLPNGLKRTISVYNY